MILAVIMAPKPEAQKNTTKQSQAKAKAASQDAQALELKKEQQNFLNTLKYRANQWNSTEAQQLLKASFESHYSIIFL